VARHELPCCEWDLGYAYVLRYASCEQIRDLSYLVSGLCSDMVKPRPEALLVSLLAEMLRRLQAGGPQLLHLSSAGLVLTAAGVVAPPGTPVAKEVIKPLLRLVLQDIVSSGPAKYLSSALGSLFITAWRMELAEVRITGLGDSLSVCGVGLCVSLLCVACVV
jgi:hypothetical protein